MQKTKTTREDDKNELWEAFLDLEKNLGYCKSTEAFFYVYCFIERVKEIMKDD